MTDDRYALIQRLLHWVIAVFVLGNLASGWIIVEFSRKDFPKGVYSDIYDLHKGLGAIILALMLCRVLTRLIYGTPSPHPVLENWQRIASKIVHNGFYVLLIIQPVLGILGVWAFPAPIPVLDLVVDNPLTKDRVLSKVLLDLHAVTGLVLMALTVLHIGGAFLHIFKRDGVFSRIGFRNRNARPGGGEG